MTKKAGALVRPSAVGGPDTVGPVAAVLKSGNYVFAQVLPGSTGVAPSVSVQVFDPHLNLISNKAYPATVYVSGVLIADVTGDGIPELIENTGPCGGGYSSCSGASVFAGNGDGDFASAPTETLPGRVLFIADVNGDGRPDVLLINDTINLLSGSSIVVAYGQSDGTIGPETFLGGFPNGGVWLTVADWNGD